MLRKTSKSLGLFVALALASATALAATTVGQPAPPFTAKDTSGKTVSLADLKGKYVVLEWVNPGCPFVRKHYESANMQATQKDATTRGAVWLAVNTTAADASEYRSPADMAAWMKQHGAAATHTLMDESGTLGRAYGARTTPHMYVIDPSGMLVYAGAIDSKPTANPADIKTATNYVKQALGEAMAGRPVSVPVTQAYGCSVKYGAG